VPALHEIQQSFGRGLRSGDFGAVAASVTHPARLSIYRNHFLISLGEALAATYPAVKAAVGEACFSGLARRFVLANPPVAPVLAEYGAEFADFLADQAEVAGLPYLPDLARLEWAMNRAAVAADAPSVGLPELAAIAPERLTASRLAQHPAIALVDSAYPVSALRDAVLAGEGFDLTGAREECLLVYRRDGAVALRNMDAGGFALLRGMFEQGRPLGQAFEAARLSEAELASVLAMLGEIGAITGVEFDHER